MAAKRDPRTYRPFVKLAPDGSIAAVVHVADGAPDPVDGAGAIYVDVSAVGTEHRSGGRTMRGGNVDLEKDVAAQAAIAVAVAVAQVVKLPPDFTPVIQPGPIGVTKGPLGV